MGYHFSDITGQKFGMLTAIKPTGERKNNRLVWECKCDCGNTTTATATVLKIGNKSSCGCIWHLPHNYTHQLSKTRLHRIWLGIRRRCNCKTDAKYKDYGGRGIKICEEWKKKILCHFIIGL